MQDYKTLTNFNNASLYDQFSFLISDLACILDGFYITNTGGRLWVNSSFYYLPLRVAKQHLNTGLNGASYKVIYLGIKDIKKDFKEYNLIVNKCDEIIAKMQEIKQVQFVKRTN